MRYAVRRGSGKGLSKMVLTGSFWMIGSRVLRTFVTLVGMIVLARTLTPSDFGVLFFGMTVVLFVMAVIEGFVEAPITRDDALTSNTLRSLLWLTLMAAIFVASVLWIAAPWFEEASNIDRLAQGLRGLAPAVIFQAPLVVGLAVLRRKHRFRAIAVISLLNVMLYVSLGSALALAGYGLWSVLIAQNIAQALAAAAVSYSAELPLLPPWRLRLGGNLQVGSWGAASRIASFAWSNIDTILAGVMLGPAAAGLYSRAYNINTQAKEPFAAIDQTMRQAFAAMRDREGGFARQNRTALRLVTLLSGFGGASIFVLRDYIIAALLGPGWVGATGAMALLAFGLPARVTRMWLDSLSVANGHMPSLLLRQCAILVIISVALGLLADRGIEWIAGVVTAAVYVSLILPCGEEEHAAGAGPTSVLIAMTPGLALMAMLAAAGEIIAMLSAPVTYVDFAGRALLVCVAGLILLVGCPDTWLTPTLAAKRRSLLGGFLHRGKGDRSA